MSLAAVFARNVRDRRRRLKLTQLEVAVRAGLSVSYISYIESNRRSPAFENIEKIAEALRLPPGGALHATEHRPTRSRHMIRLRLLVTMAALLAPLAARADRREWYTLLSVEPGVAGFSDPLQGRSGTTQFHGGLGLVGYYGLTNSLHLGAAVRFASTSGLTFSPSSAALPGGGPTYPGALLASDRELSGSALALYRFDTGHRVAPVLAGEVGFASHDFHDLAIQPQGVSFGIPLPSTRQTALFGRGSLLLEWRFADSWAFSAGAAYTRTGLPAARWQFSFPLLVGLVW